MNTLQIQITLIITSMQVLAKIRWVDEADENGPIDMDIFFDRVVIIAANIDAVKPKMPPDLIENGFLIQENIAPGVFISDEYVLTSYNPFRYIMQNSLIDQLFVKVLTEREIKEPVLHVYTTDTVTLTCARQIMPITNNSLTKEQWHGINKTHSPVHDLMVMQISKKMEFIKQKYFSFKKYPKGKTVAGPMLTRFAKEDDHLGNDVKFASLGFRNKKHANKTNKLSSRAYEEDEQVIEQCEQWLPRYWGHFICIRNVDNYIGVGSGALLIFNETLYGVGSFSLKKGNESILVFTDVRPYIHLFYGCPSPVTNQTARNETENETDQTARNETENETNQTARNETENETNQTAKRKKYSRKSSISRNKLNGHHVKDFHAKRDYL